MFIRIVLKHVELMSEKHFRGATARKHLPSIPERLKTRPLHPRPSLVTL